MRDARGNLVDSDETQEGWGIYILTPSEKKELDTVGCDITHPALFFITHAEKILPEVYFVENSEISLSMTIKTYVSMLQELLHCERDTDRKIVHHAKYASLLFKITQIVTQQAKKPHHFSLERVFAEELTDHYATLSEHFPEFGRLRELAKMTAVVRYLHSLLLDNLEKKQSLKALLCNLQYWLDRSTAIECDFEEKHDKRQPHYDAMKQKAMDSTIRAEQQEIKNQLAFLTKFENALQELGLTEQVAMDLSQTSLWVPASYHHDTKRSRFVYGGVSIQPEISLVENTNSSWEATLQAAFDPSRHIRVDSKILKQARIDLSNAPTSSGSLIHYMREITHLATIAEKARHTGFASPAKPVVQAPVAAGGGSRNGNNGGRHPPDNILRSGTQNIKLSSAIHYTFLKTGTTMLRSKPNSGSVLGSTERITVELINAMQAMGRTIHIAVKDSEDYKYLETMGAEASTNTGMPDHIIIKEDASKSALLEEFLHGVQNRIGIVNRLGVQGAEVHVKDFMIRHAKMLGLNNAADMELLAQLYSEELERFERYQQREYQP